MSTVKVKGNAGGTGSITIEAPNTNTDRTLTLPDEVGTVLTDSGIISASSSPANSISIDALGNLNLLGDLGILGFLNVGSYGAVASASTSGDFRISITNLETLTGSAWKACGMLVIYCGIDTDQTDNIRSVALVGLRGLNNWTVHSTDQIVGAVTYTGANGAPSSIDVDVVTGSIGDQNGSVFVLAFGRAADLSISITP